MRWREWGRWSWRLEWQPRGAWIGAYWERREGTMARSYHAWVCAVPTLPLHLVLVRWKRRTLWAVPTAPAARGAGAARARAEIVAWRALVEDTDHRLKRINGEEGYITFYTLPAGIWHRFLAAARGADIVGIVAALEAAAFAQKRAPGEGHADGN